MSMPRRFFRPVPQYRDISVRRLDSVCAAAMVLQDRGCTWICKPEHSLSVGHLLINICHFLLQCCHLQTCSTSVHDPRAKRGLQC